MFLEFFVCFVDSDVSKVSKFGNIMRNTDNLHNFLFCSKAYF